MRNALSSLCESSPVWIANIALGSSAIDFKKTAQESARADLMIPAAGLFLKTAGPAMMAGIIRLHSV